MAGQSTHERGEDPGASDHKKRSGADRGRWVAVIAVLLVLGLLVFWFVRDSEDEGSEAADCVRNTLRVAVAPGFKDLADQAIGVVDKDEPCIDFEVREATVKQVLADLSDPDADQPHLWIPDTPAWRSEASTTGYSVKELVPALAKSPVGIASGPMVRNDASWHEALTGDVILGDPLLDVMPRQVVQPADGWQATEG